MAIEFVDCDAHLVESPLAPECLRRWPEIFSLTEHGELLTEGRRYPESNGPGAGCPAEHGLTKQPGANPFTTAGMLADADRDGIDRMVFFPSFGLRGPTIQDRAAARAFCEFYNEWCADWCGQGDGRFFGIAIAPIEWVDDAVQVLHQAKRLGLVGAMIPPALRTRNLDHPDLAPFFRAAEELDIPLGVHGAPGIHLPKIGVDRFTNYIQVHCVSFPFDQMAAMTALVSGGVFDRHPRLRVGFMEAGAGWVPYFMDRMHEHFEKRGDWIPNGWQHDPRHYIDAGNVWVSCESEESTLPAVTQLLGSDFVMWASDYPHWDTGWPESTRPLRERNDLDDATKRKLAGENARRFYKLP